MTDKQSPERLKIRSGDIVTAPDPSLILQGVLAPSEPAKKDPRAAIRVVGTLLTLAVLLPILASALWLTLYILTHLPTF